MPRNRACLSAFAAILLFPALSSADIIYFKNGGTIEGVVRSETDTLVEMDIGFGTITCSRDEIRSIERSTSAAVAALEDKWEKKRAELRSSEEEFARERQRRFAEYDAWIREEQARAARESGSGGTVDLTRDVDSRSLLVSAVVNEKYRATLVVDTGASIVVLARKVGEELGIDLTDTKNNMVTLQLAGDHRVSAKLVTLKSVRIRDIEVKDVMAGVILEDAGPGFKDGLLGMTFLNRFNLKIDLANMKMSLEKAA